MRLLLDENLSPRLVDTLRAEFPETDHVRNVGLRGGSDDEIWQFARSNGFAIVSKDNDFRQRSFVNGHPPKVIWLSIGNAGTAAISALLRRERPRLEAFDQDPNAALLVIDGGLRSF
ncbi:MAG: DUF5615 family PIN-like protein [Myxococcota bacterium]